MNLLGDATRVIELPKAPEVIKVKGGANPKFSLKSDAAEAFARLFDDIEEQVPTKEALEKTKTPSSPMSEPISRSNPTASSAIQDIVKVREETRAKVADTPRVLTFDSTLTKPQTMSDAVSDAISKSYVISKASAGVESISKPSDLSLSGGLSYAYPSVSIAFGGIISTPAISSYTTPLDTINSNIKSLSIVNDITSSKSITTTNPIAVVTPISAASTKSDVITSVSVTPLPVNPILPIIPIIPGIGGAGGGGSSSSSRGGGILSFENQYLYGEGIGLSDFASGLNFGRASPRHHAKSAAREPVKQSSKRFVSTGRINFRGRGR